MTYDEGEEPEKKDQVYIFTGEGDILTYDRKNLKCKTCTKYKYMDLDQFETWFSSMFEGIGNVNSSVKEVKQMEVSYDEEYREIQPYILNYL